MTLCRNNLEFNYGNTKVIIDYKVETNLIKKDAKFPNIMRLRKSHKIFNFLKF